MHLNCINKEAGPWEGVIHPPNGITAEAIRTSTGIQNSWTSNSQLLLAHQIQLMKTTLVKEVRGSAGNTYGQEELLTEAMPSLQWHFVPHQMHHLWQLAPVSPWLSPWQAGWWQTHMTSWHPGDSKRGPPAVGCAHLQYDVALLHTVLPRLSYPMYKDTNAIQQFSYTVCSYAIEAQNDPQSTIPLLPFGLHMNIEEPYAIH